MSAEILEALEGAGFAAWLLFSITGHVCAAFLPWLVAKKRNHPEAKIIMAISLVIGVIYLFWRGVFILWLVCLGWAFSETKRENPKATKSWIITLLIVWGFLYLVISQVGLYFMLAGR